METCLVLDGLSHQRTSLADGIAALERLAEFGPRDWARIRVQQLRLPDTTTVWLVALNFEITMPAKRTVVPLSTATDFRCSELGVLLKEQPLELLQDAMVQFDGSVTLSNGRRLMAVYLRPAKLAYELTTLEEQIVHVALARLKEGAEYYRNLREYLPDDLKADFPPQIMLDYTKLAQDPPDARDFPKLKVIQAEYQALVPDDAPPSLNHRDRAPMSMRPTARPTDRSLIWQATPGPAPIASEALKHIAEFYAIEKDIRGRSAEERRLVRQQKS